MKKIKKLVSRMLIVVVVFGLLAIIPAKEAQAASKASVTKAVHLYVKTCDDSAIAVCFANQWDHIANLKTSSKNLKAKIVSVNGYSEQNAQYNAKIGLYASKEGIYTVTFDINDSDDEKVSSHSVKVYVNKELPIKSVTFAGGRMYSLTDKTTGKLVVSMNKGYTLKKIIIETYDKAGQKISKTVKNNSNIALGNYAYFYENGTMYDNYYNLSTSMMAPTYIRIYYIDKYTKEEMCENQMMYRVAK